MPRDSAHRIDPDDLLNAYRIGYFPMARSRDEESVVWVMPDVRGVLPLERARAPRKLLRFLAREPFDVRFNTAFGAVIAACAEQRADRPDTWINDAVIDVYQELHGRGFAHSVECWRDGALVGGLYGVSIGAVFCGESMFSRETNASKIAMLYLIARLKLAGFALLDTQFPTPHLAQFGVAEMTSGDYQRTVDQLVDRKCDFMRPPPYLSAATVAQSITQIS